MLISPFLFLPKELLKYILEYLDISDIINLKKLHPFTEIQQELTRSLNIKINKERKHLEMIQKNYVKETLYLATKNIKPVDLPDPLGPIRVTISPFFTSNETPFTNHLLFI